MSRKGRSSADRAGSHLAGPPSAITYYYRKEATSGNLVRAQLAQRSGSYLLFSASAVSRSITFRPTLVENVLYQSGRRPEQAFGRDTLPFSLTNLGFPLPQATLTAPATEGSALTCVPSVPEPGLRTPRTPVKASDRGMLPEVRPRW